MIGQIQLVAGARSGGAPIERLRRRAPALLAARRGAHARPLPARRGPARHRGAAASAAPRGEPMVVVHVLVDTGDAMGANAVNSLVEGLAPMVEELAGGASCLRILSNLADRRLARAAVRIPVGALGARRHAGRGGRGAHALRLRVRVRRSVPRRHAQQGHHERHRRRRGRDRQRLARDRGRRARVRLPRRRVPLAHDAGRSRTDTWSGTIELPMAVSTVGPVAESHPRVRLALRMLGVDLGARARRHHGRRRPRVEHGGACARSPPRASRRGTWRCTPAPCRTRPGARGAEAEAPARSAHRGRRGEDRARARAPARARDRS